MNNSFIMLWKVITKSKALFKSRLAFPLLASAQEFSPQTFPTPTFRRHSLIKHSRMCFSGQKPSNNEWEEYFYELQLKIMKYYKKNQRFIGWVFLALAALIALY